MQSKEEFVSYFEESLSPSLKALEEIRLQCANYIKYNILLFLSMVFIVFVLIFSDWLPVEQVVIPIVLVVIGFLFAIGYFSYRLMKLEYKKKYKHHLVRPIIHFVSPDLKYFPERFIPEGHFRMSRIFLEKPNIYEGDDFVEGQIDQTAFHFSEVKAQVQRTNGKNTTKHNLFHGLFFIAEFNKDFEGSTVLLPNKIGKGWRFLKRVSGLNRKERYVELEDPSLNKLFNCYSVDDIKARYILSPALMARITNFAQKYPKQALHISFVNSYLFVAIAYNKDLFEPNYFRSILNIDQALQYFEDIQFVVGIVEDLNLNTRIWSKA
jgi:hypothetical protein